MRSLICFLLAFTTLPAFGQQPFLGVRDWTALRDESSGASPYENLRYLAGLHRVPATAAFDQAAQFMLQRAREYGLADAHSEQFAIDGTKRYGLMRSYLAWTVEEARLWEIRPQHLLLGDWKTDPIHLADYSHSADVETELIDVGNGANESDYSGKDVRGKIWPTVFWREYRSWRSDSVVRWASSATCPTKPRRGLAWIQLLSGGVIWMRVNRPALPSWSLARPPRRCALACAAVNTLF